MQQNLMDEFRFESVDLQSAKNLFNHKTNSLSSNTLVLRRGQAFQILLSFKGRPFDPLKDKLVFVVQDEVANRYHSTVPSHNEDCIAPLSVEVHVSGSRQPVFGTGQPSTTQWSVSQDDDLNSSRTTSVSLLSPACASVGVYTLSLRVETRTGVKTHSLGQFTLLCNPWCQGDSVFLNSEELRNEYVRNDHGLLFRGTADYPAMRMWTFDQYEKGILDICMKLLQLNPEHLNDASMDLKNRASPVYISRVISAMINCDDGDRGVLMANQSGENDGVNASKWPGSANILWEWSKSQFSPVKYGECWVFAAVMCTVMRALGIPTRVVTIYNSAHDTNGNMVIEEYYSERGEKLEYHTQDSIWNFHVWVESWMKRPDLGQEFDGWQVLDPTPQKRSAGRFRCGPASVKAIREKKFDAQYDVPFVYAEVNADVHTMIVCNGKVLASKIDTKRVGTLICTKRPGSMQMLNLTSQYKTVTDETTTYTHVRVSSDQTPASSCISCPTDQRPVPAHISGSTDERPAQSIISCSTASKCGDTASSIPNSIAVSLNLLKIPVVGQNVLFNIKITNTWSKAKNLKVHINAQNKEYHRNPTGTFWGTSNELKIDPLETKTFKHEISFSEYRDKVLREDFMVNLAAVIEDVETGERTLASEEFNITSPLSVQD